MLRSVVCLFVLLSAVAFAQTVPGTFKSSANQAARPVWNATVLAPPVATLSNGLSPAVIANQDTLVYQVANPMTPIIASAGEYEEAEAPNDYIAGEASVYAGSESGEETQSLGQVASSYRGAKQQRRVYTNEDIDKLPTKFGPSSNPSTQPPANPQQ
jgi:hypothetical protein